MADQDRAGQRVTCVEGSFGPIWQLWRGNTLIDTYCPWNGETFPAWMARKRRWPWNTRAYRWLYKHVIERIATW